MPRRIPGSPVTVSLSTRGSLVTALMAEHLSAESGMSNIDIDATTAVGAWLASRSGALDRPNAQVRSIWIPMSGLVSKREHSLITRLVERQPDRAPLVVAVMSGPLAVRELSREIQPKLEYARVWPLAIGLPASSLRGGRPHLVQLGGLRRFAEEWDLSLAVNLAGRFDPTWEAEAAMSRLGDRLSLVRVRSSAPSRTAVGQDRVACRALHAAIDRGRTVDVAISPVRSSFLPATPRAAALTVQRATDYILERTALHAEALREGIDTYEGSPSSRGI